MLPSPFVKTSQPLAKATSRSLDDESFIENIKGLTEAIKGKIQRYNVSQGTFRVTGVQRKVDECVQQLKSQRISAFESYELQTLTSAYKQILRQNIPFSDNDFNTLTNKFKNKTVAALQQNLEFCAQVKAAVNEKNPLQKVLIETCFQLMACTVEENKKTVMDEKNCAIMFAPNWFNHNSAQAALARVSEDRHLFLAMYHLWQAENAQSPPVKIKQTEI